MENWYKVTLPARDCGVGGKMMQLEHAFMDIYSRNPTVVTREAVLDTEHTPDFEQHFFYFSPAAVKLAPQLILQYGAVTTPAPHRTERLHLIAGDAGILESLLPAELDSD